ncbi:MAG: hypothetical protein DHS20C18_47130 [Saprospiraceae bacterium]|nr:MAG: hypothetical protein DHS20C18_47130 [Saprospiraceae bacterium]
MQNYPSVTQFMATKLITFTPDMDIRLAVDTMLTKKITGAPVVNEKKEMIGMLSEVDCLKILIEGPYNQVPSGKGTVGDYMSSSVRSITSDKTILDAAYEFVHSGYKRLPVMEDGRLIGQISRVDVLRAVQKIAPVLKHVPDSWKGREPAIADHKKSRNYKHS